MSEENKDEIKMVHLRDLFQIALVIETQSKSFYEEFSEYFKDQKSKDICLELAHDENVHREKIYQHIAKWNFHALDPASLDRIDAEMKLRGIFLDYPKSSDPKELALYALEQEKRKVDFYSSFTQDFTGTWKKEQLEKLIDEEMIHVNKLEKMLADL